MLEDLRIFLEVAQAGNLSKVAQARAIAVSSVARKIDALEISLTTKLFHRTSRAIILTDAGERFLPHAKSMIAELDDAKDELSALRADPRGLLSVTAPAAFGRRYLTPAITSFLKQYPLMEIDLELSDQVIDLSAQRLDVAIRIGTLPDSDLIATRLAPLNRLACASPDYLERCGVPRSPLELIEHNCLKKLSRHLPYEWNFPGTHQNKAIPVKGSFRSDDVEALLQAAVAGMGVIHLASFIVSDMVADGKLRILFESECANIQKASQKSNAGIHAVRLPGRSHAAKAQMFINHLRQEFGSPPIWDRALGLA
ncbi:LysR family transcriptional regulator [Undibacterium sp. SXout20W]|uniref:LysR family transcriptional regulator n=1 Tax=Undibacterium sp. SXout20W TaxID=3413051 RepID=UPI003BF187BF